MAHTELGVTYDGPALADHTMDVRDLAPALLALGDLFVAAGRVIENDAEPPSLQIRATVGGSFIVDLALEAAGAWDGIKNWLNGDTATALATLSALVSSGTGVFAACLWMRNRRIDKVEHLDAGQIRLVIEEDGRKTTFEGPAELLQLIRNSDVRRAAERVVEPLKRPGIDSLELRADTGPAVTIRSEDVGAFAIPNLPEEIINEDESVVVVTIGAPALTGTNRWHLSDGEGGRNFVAELTDDHYQSRVDRGAEAFRAGDMLRCKIKTVQTRRNSRLYITREIVEVIEHIPREVQMSIGDAIDDLAGE